jgi:hypothetical protein
MRPRLGDNSRDRARHLIIPRRRGNRYARRCYGAKRAGVFAQNAGFITRMSERAAAGFARLPSRAQRRIWGVENRSTLRSLAAVGMTPFDARERKAESASLLVPGSTFSRRGLPAGAVGVRLRKSRALGLCFGSVIPVGTARRAVLASDAGLLGVTVRVRIARSCGCFRLGHGDVPPSKLRPAKPSSGARRRVRSKP